MKTIQMPYSKLAQALGVKDVYLKREDQHKYGSHKGRSIPVMIKKYFKEDDSRNFVISSSGNAALAAVHAVQVHNHNNPEKIKLTVFVGQNINPQKMKNLMNTIIDANIKIEQVERPKQTAFQIEKEGSSRNLRQSTDNNALLGYYELAQELDSIPNLSAVFIPTSSGTTAQGMAEAFLGESYLTLDQKPQIHIVQTTTCNPIASMLVKDGSVSPSTTDSIKSIAGAIVDKIAHRKDRVVELIKKSEGAGWIVTNEEIKDAQKLVKQTTSLQISTNSALSVAGLKKAKDNGFGWGDGVVVCLVTGM
ncbi:MAG: PLP-dependent lyase/thiolase [Candidatus Magasanikbacteria bacterium]|jgi:threonine synthase|nr:PLP-dependent lyase/thiolase [Candidatus Magasanikbacteria bacterium]MBT4314755.1 PLP-dependent lyase/thiolase [Candidatus Magasanikbacteria bacterium]MBT4547532.1 PLP-dependent lyase/thiolase [Candidatus Magasanikbacteria bacterium]MBT6819402.1 PLP-dependent lyase/thiolase [Candidatus Magasanikbacteria bacterium]